MNNWSLNAKIYLVIGIFVAACSTVSYLGIRKIGEVKISLNGIVDGPATRQRLMADLRYQLASQIITEKNFIITRDHEEMKEYTKGLNDGTAKINELTETLAGILCPPGKKNNEEFKQIYEKWWDLDKKIRDLVLQGKNDEAGEWSSTVGRDLRFKMEGLISATIARNNQFMKDDVAEADRIFTSSRQIMLLVTGLSLLIGLGLSVLILRALGKSINQVILSLSDNSQQVTSAAQQIAASSEELSKAATEQAASLEETASSIEEMNSMVQKNAENARQASEVSRSSSESAQKGREVVTDMTRAIDEISVSNNSIMNQIDESNQQISEIVKVIAEIGNKTKVINDIVFQTKLLSFNASVEAARAGEHGKGFAVVAEEVGNLAQMSGNAAKEISSMLDGSIQKVERIVDDTKTKVDALIANGKMKIEVGTKIAQQCGHVLEEIVQNVNNVTQMAQEISSACQEQSQGVQEITRAMNQLDQVTQTNAATSEEAASAAEELSSQSESLKSTVGVLVAAIRGGGQNNARTSNEETPETRSARILPLKKQKNPASVRASAVRGHASGGTA